VVKNINLKKKIQKINKRIEKAAQKSDRSPSDIILIAASKYVNSNELKVAIENGIRHVGENRAKKLISLYNDIGDLVIWHFIGHLQSRKAKLVVPIVEYIHSIDSISTIKEIDKRARNINKIQKILIEVNISGEETKYGIEPNSLIHFIKEINGYKNIKIVGLMTMAPLTNDMSICRRIFKELREHKNIVNRIYPNLSLKHLSMGMSNDFEVAIEEGSTMVRIGSAIFK
jgi:hypothetical protein